MRTGQKLEHGKDWSGHVARITGTFKCLPGSGLQTAPASRLNWVAHECCGIYLTQSRLEARSLQLVATRRWHV